MAVNELKIVGINSTFIGKITKNRGVLISNREEIEVEDPERDGLFNIK